MIRRRRHSVPFLMFWGGMVLAVVIVLFRLLDGVARWAVNFWP